MRKDSELFLRRVLEYRRKINKDSFIIGYRFFEEIPSLVQRLERDGVQVVIDYM